MNSKKCEVTQMGYSPWNGIDTKHSVASKPLGCMETLGNQRCKAEVECEGGASAQQLITFRFGQKVSGRSGIAPARRGMSRTSFFQTVGSALRRRIKKEGCQTEISRRSGHLRRWSQV